MTLKRGKAMRRTDRGMVTIELAVGLLTAGLAVVLACWVVNLVILQTRCADTAAQVARQLARDDQPAAQQAQQRAPKGATTRISHAERTVTVRVDLDARLGKLGPVHLVGGATADLEPGVTR
ncbi:TadE family type IV pilus minor pilin [Luteococcus sp. H138]|uniref:TadE family type IV pilus minor pilin n=1 Tax=unclassified Luteococcus TaxID=2639923 RepID=UPI00313DCFD3